MGEVVVAFMIETPEHSGVEKQVGVAQLTDTPRGAKKDETALHTRTGVKTEWGGSKEMRDK